VPLRPEPMGPVPEQTARVARAAFPHGNPWLRLRDELGTMYKDETFTPLVPVHGRPAEAPWRLALMTVLQFAEGRSDRQAAEAAREEDAAQVGTDGLRLLREAVSTRSAPAWRRGVPAVQILRRVWVQQVVTLAGQVQLRAAADLPPSGLRINSPYV